MKTLALILLALFLASGAWGQSDDNRRPKTFNLDKNGVALKGYDPVSYQDGQPQKGQDAFAATDNGIRYLFASQDHRDRFQSNPEKYEPAYGGWCAWAMLEGDKVDIDPESYKIIDGRLYVFYNGFWGDTLKKWNTLAGKETESALVERADANWSQIRP
ncbi:MAG: hypothetical protein JJV98_11970 [Desulfosarcina sp.]|nr:hypothetical protein [Desulfobacterales bacterium]